jgi:hypothetical protein
MNCKCSELNTWLMKEINHLKEIKDQVSNGSKLHGIIETKIFAYTIVLEGLN